MSSSLSLPRRLQPARPHVGDVRAFLNWLACWLILPNLPFLPITLMGGPPRYTEIVICGIVGLAARQLPYPLRVVGFLALVTYITLSFIASMFNMSVKMIMSVISLVLDLDLVASPEYIAGAALLFTCCAGALVLLRQRQDFSSWKWAAVGSCAVLGCAAADVAVSHNTLGSYTRLAPEGTPFSSAVSNADLLGLADGDAHIMLVMVEAMGQPVDPELRSRLLSLWSRPELAERFAMSTGETAFFGSTTSAEIRELCGRWGNYPEVTQPDSTCLGSVLTRRGYRTSAYHGFTASFFQRNRWYPLVGIERPIFRSALVERGAHLCSHVFSGACDRDIPAMIAHDLKHADGPQFAYWLTLNSHLPVIASRQLGTEDCHRFDARLDAELPMICRLFALWGQTADELAEVISKPDFPPTHILIVGDHMPPFTHQKSRLQFESDKVPWILLRDRRAQEPASPPAT